MHDGIKCMRCIFRHLNGKVITLELVQEAVNSAAIAVTTYNGNALCVAHLVEKAVYVNLREI